MSDDPAAAVAEPVGGAAGAPGDDRARVAGAGVDGGVVARTEQEEAGRQETEQAHPGASSTHMRRPS